jgi:hypothetical protein
MRALNLAIAVYTLRETYQFAPPQRSCALREPWQAVVCCQEMAIVFVTLCSTVDHPTFRHVTHASKAWNVVAGLHSGRVRFVSVTSHAKLI